MATIELTDEIRDEEPVAYLVFRYDQTIHDYEVFVTSTSAKERARYQAEKESVAKKSPPGEWPIYPLYASHPEMVEPISCIGKRK